MDYYDRPSSPWEIFMQKLKNYIIEDFQYMFYVTVTPVDKDDTWDFDFIWKILSKDRERKGKSFLYDQEEKRIIIFADYFYGTKELIPLFREVDNIELVLMKRKPKVPIKEEQRQGYIRLAREKNTKFQLVAGHLSKDFELKQDGDNYIFTGFTTYGDLIISVKDKPTVINKKLGELVGLNIGSIGIDMNSFKMLIDMTMSMKIFDDALPIKLQINGLNFIYAAYYGTSTIDSAG